MNELLDVVDNIDEKENNGSRRTRSSKNHFLDIDKSNGDLLASPHITDNSHLDVNANENVNIKKASTPTNKNSSAKRSKVVAQKSNDDDKNESSSRSTRLQQRTLNSNEQNNNSSSKAENHSPKTPNLRAPRKKDNTSTKSISPKGSFSKISTLNSEEQAINSEAEIKNVSGVVDETEESSLVEKTSVTKILENNLNVSKMNRFSSSLSNLNESFSPKASKISETPENSPYRVKNSMRRSLRGLKIIDKAQENFIIIDDNQSSRTRDIEMTEKNNNQSTEENNNLKENILSDLNPLDLNSENNISIKLEDFSNNNVPEATSEVNTSENDSLSACPHEDLQNVLEMEDEDLVGMLDASAMYNMLDNEKKPDDNDFGHSSADYGPTFNYQGNMFKDEIPEDYNSASPSAESLDSAKGSSLATENESENSGLYTTGDLYWAQIFKYCYWPCMVCPDPEGKLVQLQNAGRAVLYMVHVRFFADNGRRNWVKQESLLPFINFDNFVQLAEEAKIKYGKSSAKYKQFVPSKLKKNLWMDAIREANIIADSKYEDRLDNFFKLFEKSKNFDKSEKKRRQSMYLTKMETSEIVESEKRPFKSEKRERSLSPSSPAYSPISHKRRKVSLLSPNKSGSVDNHQSESPSSNAAKSNINYPIEIQKLLENPEFNLLHEIMKEYFLFGCQDPRLELTLISGLKNLWAIREINRLRISQQLSESNTSTNLGMTYVQSVSRKGEGTLKRLSNRIKDLNLRKNFLGSNTSPMNDTNSSTSVSASPQHSTVAVERTKKIFTRPIEEVIDDIFNLDSKYLFKGLQREYVCKYCFKSSANLVRCSKKCLTWFHIECLTKPSNPARKRGKKKKSVTMANTSESIELKPFEGPSHVTGDDVVDANQNNIAHDSNKKVEDSSTANMTSAITTLEAEKPICNECYNNDFPNCCICLKNNEETDKLISCQMQNCQKFFHATCTKYWPQARTNSGGVRCPSHVCHTCVSDDPKGKFQHIANAKLVKCVKCPSSYHMDSTCIPAGSQILNAAHIICPRHHKAMVDTNLNVNWCYICASGGGDVLCCETCPFVVHEKCLNFTLGEKELYICEECESGRMPLYGEMVWVKFNAYRWWPAIILPPTEVPVNIMRKPHNPLEFVVRFFGTHDHGWISRRRVYLYAEGDYSENPKSKSALDHNYNKGVEEAKHLYEIIKLKKNDQRTSTENKEKVHPQPYTKIRTNRPVPPVKLHVDFESLSKCGCSDKDENPCARDSDCINRALFHECNPKLCPAGDKCQNQMFEKRKSPRLEVVYMKERGFGLVTRENIEKDSFVIEYVGEIINDAEFQRRVAQKNEEREENFYFLSVEKDYIIDAGPKGNLARFMNHSCDPNCETQKWSVNSINRVGLFAIKDIPANTELTFNYHWDELLGSEKKNCFCGASKCAGQIGAKLKQTAAKVPIDFPLKIKIKKKRSVKRLQAKSKTEKLKGKSDSSLGGGKAIKAGTNSLKLVDTKESDGEEGSSKDSATDPQPQTK